MLQVYITDLIYAQLILFCSNRYINQVKYDVGVLYMRKIEGSPKSLKQLLHSTKYSIHYYQREYMWQRKHIEELIDDLTSEFLDYYQEGDSRHMVKDYGIYFMGSIVLAGDEKSIIDGQQRFPHLHYY